MDIRRLELGLTLTLLLLSGLAGAAEEQADSFGNPFYKGGYVAPMASYVTVDNAFATDDGLGGVLALGYRQQGWAIELGGIFTTLSGKNGNGDTDLRGANLSALVFPLRGLPNLYALAGVGGLEVKDYPGIADTSFTLGTLEAGLGHLFAFSFGNYEMALRAEARYRKNRREKDISDVPRLGADVPRNFDDVLINLGLQFPFGRRAASTAAVEAPVAVVPAAADCVDRLPQDPGCAAADEVEASPAPAAPASP